MRFFSQAFVHSLCDRKREQKICFVTGECRSDWIRECKDKPAASHGRPGSTFVADRPCALVLKRKQWMAVMISYSAN